MPIISLLIVTSLFRSATCGPSRARGLVLQRVDLTPSLTRASPRFRESGTSSRRSMDYIAVKLGGPRHTSLGVFIVIELPLIVFMSLSFYMMARKG